LECENSPIEVREFGTENDVPFEFVARLGDKTISGLTMHASELG
jgi:hypothetical protein